MQDPPAIPSDKGREHRSLSGGGLSLLLLQLKHGEMIPMCIPHRQKRRSLLTSAVYCLTYCRADASTASCGDAIRRRPRASLAQRREHAAADVAAAVPAASP